MSVISLSMEGAQGIAQSISALSSSVETLAQRQAANTRATMAGARASGQAAAGMQGFAQQAQQSVQRIQGVAGAIQGLVSQLGSHNRTAGLVASVAGATAQFASMGSMLGPGGTVIGGLVGLVVGLRGVVAEMNDVETAAREAAAEVTRLASARISARTEARTSAGLLTGDAGGLSESDLATRSEEARVRAEAAMDAIAPHAARLARLRGRGYGDDDPGVVREETALAALRASLAAQNAIVDGVRREVDARADAAREAEHMAELQREEAEALASEERAYADAAAATAALDARHRRERAGGRRRADDPLSRDNATTEGDLFGLSGFDMNELFSEERARVAEETAERMGRIREEDAADFETWVERRAEGFHATQELEREHAEQMRELSDAAKTAAVEFNTGYVTSIDAVAEAWRHANQAAREAGTGMLSTGRLLDRGLTAIGNNISEVVGGQMTAAFSSAVGAWLDGSKSFVDAAEEMAKGVIKALVQESIVQGVTELARGIADLASYRYDSAALHFAAAAAWAVVGGVAGGIGAATGAFGGAGKGQESASQKDLADRDREAQRGAAAGTTVVNIYTTGLPMTKSDVAAGTFRGLRDAQRHGYLGAGALGMR